MAGTELPSREELFELYRIAVDEYRFEVRLNWERMRHYLVLSGGTLAAAAGLQRIGAPELASGWAGKLAVSFVFLFGCAVSLLGIHTIGRGREYYRASVFKKTLIEEKLGLNAQESGYTDPLASLAIATTRDMGESRKILEGGSGWVWGVRLEPGTIVFSIQVILALFATLHFLCGILVSRDLIIDLAAGLIGNLLAQVPTIWRLVS